MSTTTNNKDEGEDILDVVIIGAGWAGIGAARYIHTYNNNNTNQKTKILILEARDYVGGRSRTVKMTDGTSVEMGSATIHGSEDNIVLDIMKGAGIKYSEEEDTCEVYSNDPFLVGDEKGGDSSSSITAEVIANSLVEEVEHNCWTGPGGFLEYERKRREKNKPSNEQSLRDVADRYIKEKELSGVDLRYFEYCMYSNVVTDIGADPSELSAKYWDYGNWTEGEDVYLITDTNAAGEGGFSAAIDVYAAPILSKIRLNSPVTSIDYSSPVVTIQYTTICDDKTDTKEIKAQHVIVTVPLGVLKANTIKFTPPLPVSKQNAIDQLGNGSLTKCVLLFDESDIFWPKNKEWIMKIADERASSDAHQRNFAQFYNPYNVNGGRPLLIGEIAGCESVRVEKLTDEEIVKEMLTSLRSMFGFAVVPAPKEVAVSRWGVDEFSRGAYSFYKVGSTPQSRLDIGACVERRLFFAGEATDVDNPQTVHGALASGRRSAREIVAGLVV